MAKIAEISVEELIERRIAMATTERNRTTSEKRHIFYDGLVKELNSILFIIRTNPEKYKTVLRK